MSNLMRVGNLSWSLLPTDIEGLDGPAELALDVRWSWNHAADGEWQQADPESWALTHHPWGILQSATAGMVAALSFSAAAGHACGIAFDAAAHLKAHPEFEWQRALLRDMPVGRLDDVQRPPLAEFSLRSDPSAPCAGARYSGAARR